MLKTPLTNHLELNLHFMLVFIHTIMAVIIDHNMSIMATDTDTATYTGLDGDIWEMAVKERV